jgi:hypothetical protein
MNLSRVARWTGCSLGAAVLGVYGSLALGQAGGTGAPLTNAQKLRMQPEEAVGTVKVFGDQAGQGFYVYRNRFGPRQTSRPHYHDKDRWVTVLKGTWHTGQGDVFKPETMVPIKEGGFMFHPAFMHHYDGSMDDTETIVQIMGNGPAITYQTELDEKGNPIGSNPLNPNRGRGAGAPAAPVPPPGK